MRLNKQLIESLLSLPVDSNMIDHVANKLRNLFPVKKDGNYTEDEVKVRLQEVLTIMEEFSGDIEVDCKKQVFNQQF